MSGVRQHTHNSYLTWFMAARLSSVSFAIFRCPGQGRFGVGDKERVPGAEKAQTTLQRKCQSGTYEGKRGT